MSFKWKRISPWLSLCFFFCYCALSSFSCLQVHECNCHSWKVSLQLVMGCDDCVSFMQLSIMGSGSGISHYVSLSLTFVKS